MEDDDQQKPYYVVRKDDIKEKMQKQIDDISEIFSSVSKSNATILLMNLRWNSRLVSELLTEDKEKLFAESGLKPVEIDSRPPDLSDSSCDEFYEFDDDFDDDDDDDDDLISTPFCSHKFCTNYWREYLEKNFYSLEKNQTAISCPDPDCGAAVGPETIEKLTIRDKAMYESYLLRSFLEGIKKNMIKQCPAPDCNYVIEFHREIDVEDYSLNVVCLCGHIFCWRCLLESHRPVTCNNASDWLSRDLKNLLEESYVSSNISWIETNTKPCPHCLCPVVLDGLQIYQFLTCACSGRFCWKCLRSEESHRTESGFFGDCAELEMQWSREEVEIPCLDRWEACQISLEEAKSDLRAFEESSFKKKPSVLYEQHQYTRTMREGFMLIAQCRKVLKWSCVYDYFHTDYETAKKEYLRFLQENASALVQSYSKTLKEETEKTFSAPTFGELCDFRSTTSNIGNYFYHFIKAVQDGLVDVKVRSYDNFAGPYWFCDRCTYGNTWFHKECTMCCDSTATPVEELSDLSPN